MSDFTNGVFNGFDKDEMPLEPTVEQMRAFAHTKKITPIEAWHMSEEKELLEDSRCTLQHLDIHLHPSRLSSANRINSRRVLPGNS